MAALRIYLPLPHIKREFKTKDFRDPQQDTQRRVALSAFHLAYRIHADPGQLSQMRLRDAQLLSPRLNPFSYLPCRQSQRLLSALRLDKHDKKQVVFTLAPWERAGVKVAGSARAKHKSHYSMIFERKASVTHP
jgi:hypothetical protein